MVTTSATPLHTKVQLIPFQQNILLSIKLLVTGAKVIDLVLKKFDFQLAQLGKRIESCQNYFLTISANFYLLFFSLSIILFTGKVLTSVFHHARCNCTQRSCHWSDVLERCFNEFFHLSEYALMLMQYYRMHLCRYSTTLRRAVFGNIILLIPLTIIYLCNCTSYYYMYWATAIQQHKLTVYQNY